MSADLFAMTGQVVVVTGGRGQLGRQFGRALVERGARVASFDLVPREDPHGRGGDYLALQVDVTRPESVTAGLARVVEAWGVPSGLVNAAALDSPPGAPVAENGPFETYPEESWDRVMEVNSKGVFLCCQIVGGAMARAGRGSIVNISSIYGLVSPDQRLYEFRRRGGQEFFKPVAYSVSKSSLFNLTRYLATYWAPAGVRVNSLTLGGVYNDQHAEFVAAYSARVPLGRMAQPDEYNGAIVFLLSNASRYMTGANLVIDGGWTAW